MLSFIFNNLCKKLDSQNRKLYNIYKPCLKIFNFGLFPKYFDMAKYKDYTIIYWNKHERLKSFHARSILE